ncbi:hypothetical protein K431DRAFT_27577 [Polychaeton citri CBS 116435]|uniref:C2H2-type domain-containing protein n=1 Tax=Polychaeton citri CBS 116435 TaxID=1314669 RepID=A0A9P4UQW3_9PEZI|nr:hypothetical protein K431DRAFT_27577 [Polychaeton citri CBS 116435]
MCGPCQRNQRLIMPGLLMILLMAGFFRSNRAILKTPFGYNIILPPAVEVREPKNKHLKDSKPVSGFAAWMSGAFPRTKDRDAGRADTSISEYVCLFEMLDGTQCLRKFNSESVLRQHQCYHAKPLTCRRGCNKLFMEERDHQRHELTHTGARPYPCPYCSYASMRKDQLKRHMRKVHPEPESDDIVAGSKPDNLSAGPSSTNANASGLSSHRSWVEVSLPQPDTLVQPKEQTHPEPTFQCPQCSRILVNKDELGGHMK